MWALKRGAWGSRKAFTLIEMAISGVITALLAVGAMYWLYANTDLRKVQATKKELQFENRDLINLIRKDLNTALKVSGSTGECRDLPATQCFPGISRIGFDGKLLKAREVSEQYDGIRILSTGGLSQKAFIDQPTEDPIKNVTVTDRLFKQHPEASEPYVFNANLFRLIRELFLRRETSMAYLSNAQISHIAKFSSVLDSGEELEPYRLRLESPGTPKIPLSEIVNTETNIAPVFVIEWVVNPGTKQLIRRKRRGVLPTDPLVEHSEQILAEGIREFKIDYSFANHRIGSPTIDWPQSAEFYSHIRDPRMLAEGNFFKSWSESGDTIAGQCDDTDPENRCCSQENKCVTWQDVESVRIGISYERKMNINTNYMAATGEDFSVAHGWMNWQTAALVFPESYSMQGKLTETTGEQLDCHLNAANRCGRNPSCEFDGTDPNLPNWKGFGNPNSVYCICGGTVGSDASNFVPPETPEGRSRVQGIWDNTLNDAAFYDHPSGEEHILDGLGGNPNLKRALACMSYFDVVTDYEWRNVHHIAYLIRTCMPSPDIVRRAATETEKNDDVYGNPIWIYHADNFQGTLADGNAAGDGLSAFAQAMETGTFPSGITQDEYMKCDTFSYCDSPVLKNVLGRFRGGSGSPWHRSDNPNDPGTWTPKPYRNYCGCLLEQTSGQSIRYDYNLRCNHNVRPENINGSRVKDWSGQEIDRPVCTTTWDPVRTPDEVVDYGPGRARKQKVYQVRKSGGVPAFPQGLASMEEALLCQCYAESFEQNYEIDWNGDGALEDYRPSIKPPIGENIPGSHGFSGTSSYVDFREPESISGCGFENSTVRDASQIDSLHNPPGVARRAPGGGYDQSNLSRLLSMNTMQVMVLWTDGSVDAAGQPIVNRHLGQCAQSQNALLPAAKNSGSVSSSLAPCTNPEETFAARQARGEISTEQMNAYYADMDSRYVEGGSCLDRSSYCSPKCGQWMNHDTSVNVGLVQARNFLINGKSQNDPDAVNRNLLPDYCGGPGSGSSSQ